MVFLFQDHERNKKCVNYSRIWLPLCYSCFPCRKKNKIIKEITAWEKKKIRKLVLTDEWHKYLIEKNATDYNSFLFLKGMRQWLHPIREITYITKATEKFFSYFVVISQLNVYSLEQVTVWDMTLAAFHGCQHMVNLIYSCFSVSFTSFQPYWSWYHYLGLVIMVF